MTRQLFKQRYSRKYPLSSVSPYVDVRDVDGTTRTGFFVP